MWKKKLYFIASVDADHVNAQQGLLAKKLQQTIFSHYELVYLNGANFNHCFQALSLSQKICFFWQFFVFSQRHYYYFTSDNFPAGFRKIRSRNIIYDYYDRNIHPFDDAENRRLRQNEAYLLASSRLILINSHFYQQRLLSLNPTLKDKLHLIPVGYQLKQLKAVWPTKQIANYTASKRIVYLGEIADRLNFRLIKKIIKEHNDWQFDFYGPINSDHWRFFNEGQTAAFVESLSATKNVRFYPTISAFEIAKTLNQYDFAWIPYDLKCGFNQFCMPTKFFEYAMLGLSIMSTPIPSLQEQQLKGLRFFANASEFNQQLKKSYALRQKQKKEVAFELREMAKKHDLQCKLKQLTNLFLKKTT